jgi:hypothetical protein
MSSECALSPNDCAPARGDALPSAAANLARLGAFPRALAMKMKRFTSSRANRGLTG